MPILERRAGRSASRFSFLTCGLGVIFGLLFGFPPAYAGHAMKLSPSWNVGAWGMGMLAGLLLAFLFINTLMEWPQARVEDQKRPSARLKSRLAREKDYLNRLAERGTRADRGLEKLIEQRIVWSELLELELQEIDEQMQRISSRMAEPGSVPGEGGRYGRDGA